MKVDHKVNMKNRLTVSNSGPPSSYPPKFIELEEITRRMSALSPEHGNAVGSTKRRGSTGSASSREEMAKIEPTNFDFDALVIIEGVDSQGQHVRRHTKAQAMIDTGSDLNMVSKTLLTKADVDEELIEKVDKSTDVKGFEGSRFKMTRRIKLV